MKNFFRSLLFSGILLFLMSVSITAQRNMEFLDRGVVAIRTSSNEVFVNWRRLGTDPDGISFNLYRESTLIRNTDATSYTDNTSNNSTYTVRPVIDGNEQSGSTSLQTWGTNFLSIPLQIPPGGTTPDGVNYSYTANDCSVGDLDGDGQYEIILKWDPTNSKDNSQSGYTGNVYIDAYALNGTHLWRIDLGRNIRAGAHYTQFMVYDLDSDGKAEIICKTADGTIDGVGNIIGNALADFRNSKGYILSGPEYLTVFNGETGAAMQTVNYLPARGNVGDWGDTYGNRVDRFLAGIAYLDGSKPSVVMCRGYYTRSVLVAWDWRDGQLRHRWTFDTDNGYSAYAGQGNHSLSIADVDEDGRDEIIYGAMAVDDNGSGLWNTGLNHGDALHVSDIDISRPGLEVWGIHEGTGTPGSALLDARTGEILWQTDNSDVGRGVAADLTAAYPGMECWGGTSGLRSSTNASAGSTPSSSNHLIWWDGDELRELLNGVSISKYGSGEILNADGCSSNNGTKSNPALTADIFGDWREEAIWRTSDNRYLRIYATTNPSSRKMYTLMHDPQYRLSIAWQNVAYNQPPHTGFFLGAGMAEPPTPDIVLVGGGNTNNPPSVSISYPSHGDEFTANQNISISANALDSDGNIQLVEFFAGTNKIGEDSSAPYHYTWNTSVTGEYSITVRATDDQGAISVSPVVLIFVLPDDGTEFLTIQENEIGFCGVDGTIDNNNTGYTGDGFANTTNAAGTGIIWKVSVSESGNYSAEFRYANGASTDRTANLLVNGSFLVSGIDFPVTGSWTSWSREQSSVYLNQGINELRLEASTGSGLANIDYLRLSGAPSSAANCEDIGLIICDCQVRHPQLRIVKILG